MTKRIIKTPLPPRFIWTASHFSPYYFFQSFLDIKIWKSYYLLKFLSLLFSYFIIKLKHVVWQHQYTYGGQQDNLFDGELFWKVWDLWFLASTSFATWFTSVTLNTLWFQVKQVAFPCHIPIFWESNYRVFEEILFIVFTPVYLLIH